MADIPIQEAGDTITFQSADAGGDSFTNDGKTQLWVVGPSSEFKLLLASARECNFGVHPAHELVVPTGETQVVSDRFAASRFNDSAGKVSITYDPSAVGIQIAAIRSEVLLKDV